MSVSVTIYNGLGFVSIALDVVELPERRIRCDVACEPKIETPSGERYTTESIHVLCIEGMRMARRQLSIANGLHVSVSDIRGILERIDEVGVCHATELAIVRTLAKDDCSAVVVMPGWNVSD